MGRSLQIMVMALTVMVAPAFADNTTICRPGYGNRALECLARDTDRDDTTELSGRAVHKVRECTRIEKLLADPQTRQLLMQEPEGERAVRWYAGNCPLGKSKG